MKKILILALFAVCLVQCTGKEETVDYIDPFIGTDGLGHTTPAATTPFGMIQLGPSMEIEPWDWKRTSGYHYSELFIKGFAHNHISGAGLCGLGDILVMPMTGELKAVPGTFENPESGYMSRYVHEEEEASAGYYSVRLADYGILAEMTATPRTGFHRYTVENADSVHIIFDPIHGIGEHRFYGEIEFLSPTEMRGYKQSTGSGGVRKAYFYARFSRPFDSYGVVTDNIRYPERKTVSSETAKGYVTFRTKPGDVLEITVALSHTGYDGAMANYMAEAEGKTFDKVRKEARTMWQEKCDKFEIDGSRQDKRTFYTAVYHSFFSPNLISDVTGDYFANGKKLHSDIVQYSNFSTWDTYRAAHPLYTLVEQKGTRDFINSLASRRTEAGTDLPLWECMGYDNCCMIGRSPVAIMSEAILKDIPGINIADSYISMYESLFATNKCSWWYGYNQSGMEGYIHRYYVTGDIGCAVSKTTEYNYYDYAMARVAEKLGKKEDAEYFHARSLGHRELWNPEKKFLWPRYEDGTWREMNLKDWEDLKVNYVSGNIWGYSTYTPHDMDYMIGLVGGKEEYVKWLDAIFNDNTPIGGEQHVDISGFIGKYGHGDEPSHQMPYLYAVAGAPEKTQAMVHRICREMYDDTPNGLVNNDDLGQMSAWYIFSSLGFYPVSPASCTYVLGTPLHRSAKMHFENGRTLTIATENWAPDKYLVDKVLWNGQEVEGYSINHKDIMQGGVLTFVMK